MINRKTTKDYIADSAIELLSKKPVEKITVTQIARNCGLSTRTFYNNFADKYALFLWIYFRRLEEYYQMNLDHMSFRVFIHYSGQVLLDYYQFFYNFQQYRGQNQFREAIFQPLFDYYIRIVEDVFHDPVTPEIRESIDFFVLGMISYVGRSYQAGGLRPLPETTDLFIRVMPEKLKKYI